MSPAQLVELIWWIALAVALLETLVILKLVFLVMRVLGDLLRLGRIIREAARGVERNTAPLERLAAVDAPRA